MGLYVIILSLLLQGVGFVTCGYASEADLEWTDAIGFAKGGQYDFAFMDFRSLAQDYPGSRYGMAAQFAQGEYYFLENDLTLASETFRHFYAAYPKHEEAMAALAYLFAIAKMEKNTKSAAEYRERVASFRQLTFIFKDKKSFKFLSGLQRKHRLVYHINKVDLYVNGRLFTEVPF